MQSNLDHESSPKWEAAVKAQEIYRPMNWAEVRSLIENNNLSELTRSPIDLHRYASWKSSIQNDYNDVSAFIYQNRLGWEPLSRPRQEEFQSLFEYHDRRLFANPRDYKILKNDWPYGVEADITHLVVWLKTPIPVTDGEGDITEQARKTIQAFVEKTFMQKLKPEYNSKVDDLEDRVLWFKNWASLQSIRGIEHFHVLIRDAPQGFVARVTEDYLGALQL
ncbi:MAG: hypothetical protein M1825_004312 [Sarcosagium campestre]|nr:MAG: hypothetical protein M1825_004312 [Sarcosagium campestre]